MPIIDKYNQRADKVNSLACVGLDSEFAKIPEHFKQTDNPQFEFNKWVIDQTHEFVAAYKANIAFYDQRGDQGLKELKMTEDYIKENHPGIFRICDSKRGDIGNTNKGYVEELFDWLDFDAITLHPYMGKESLLPFLVRSDKGCIILCRTSNPGAGEFQDMLVDGKPVWHIVSEKVRDDWNANENCMLVVGVTVPEEAKKIREIVGDMTFLMPGAGAQGGNIKDTVKAALNSEKKGFILNSSRGVIFAENPAEEAQKLREEINKYR